MALKLELASARNHGLGCLWSCCSPNLHARQPSPMALHGPAAAIEDPLPHSRHVCCSGLRPGTPPQSATARLRQGCSPPNRMRVPAAEPRERSRPLRAELFLLGPRFFVFSAPLLALLPPAAPLTPHCHSRRRCPPSRADLGTLTPLPPTRQRHTCCSQPAAALGAAATRSCRPLRVTASCTPAIGCPLPSPPSATRPIPLPN